MARVKKLTNKILFANLKKKIGEGFGLYPKCMGCGKREKYKREREEKTEQRTENREQRAENREQRGAVPSFACTRMYKPRNATQKRKKKKRGIFSREICFIKFLVNLLHQLCSPCFLLCRQSPASAGSVLNVARRLLYLKDIDGGRPQLWKVAFICCLCIRVL